MRRSIAVLAVAASAIGLATAADPMPTADKLVGKWTLSKSEKPLPPGVVASLTFAKDGSATQTIEFEGKKDERMGTWKLVGSKLSLTRKGPDGVEKTMVLEIKILTDDELVAVDEAGKKDELKKVKEAKK